MTDKFMFFDNFKTTADKLPDDLRLKFYDALTDYVFKGIEPDDAIISALITAFKPSLDKVETRGGARDGAGRPKNNIDNQKNQNNSKIIKDNQNNQSFLETETRNKKQETEIKKEIIKEKTNQRFGECKNVLLTDEQYKKLSGEHPDLNLAIEKMDTWLGTSGSKYKNKNHYAYFKSNSWIWKDIPKKTDNLFTSEEDKCWF